MKQNNLTNKKILATVTGGVAAAYVLATVALTAYKIIEYDTKDLYSYNSLQRAEKKLEQAQEHLSNTFERLTDDSFIYQQLYADARYSQLFNEYIELDKKLSNANTYTDALYQKMWNRRDELLELMALHEDSLRTHYTKNHPEMVHANKMVRRAQCHLDKVQKHCAVRDSIKQIPMTQRIKSNWDRFCKDRQMIKNIKQK